MSESKRSFFSTIPGLITGLAGLLTGIVGLVTVLIQLGVLGGDDDSDTTATTVPASVPAGGSQGATGGGGGGTTTTEAGTFTVSETSLEFTEAAKEKTVTIRNTSDSARITVMPPRVSGDDPGNFSASFGSCTNAPLAPNLTCTVKVTFAPAGALRRYSATLQIQASGAPRAAEVRLNGSSLLGG